MLAFLGDNEALTANNSIIRLRYSNRAVSNSITTVTEALLL